MYTGDTIAAIATALSPAGINIIRISGENAFSVTASLFRSARGKEFSSIPSGTVSYGFIEFEGEVLDEVLPRYIHTAGSLLPREFLKRSLRAEQGLRKAVNSPKELF